jgi:hypothetical protein
MVTQVVIQPRDRLVTHAVVSASDFYDGKFVFHEYFVPVEAMEVVNKEGIILKRNGPPLNAFSTFEPSAYPPPWIGSLLIHMEPETVRWTCDEREKAETHQFHPLVSDKDNGH